MNRRSSPEAASPRAAHPAGRPGPTPAAHQPGERLAYRLREAVIVFGLVFTAVVVLLTAIDATLDRLL